MKMADADTFDRIHAILTNFQLSGETAPFFKVIYPGDPLAIGPQNRTCAYWVLDLHEPDEGPMTFDNWMYEHSVRVKCFWLPQPLDSGRNRVEREIFSVSHELPGDFLADVKLGGYVESCIPEDIVMETEQWPPGVDSPLFRTLTFDLKLKNLEGEAITIA